MIKGLLPVVLLILSGCQTEPLESEWADFPDRIATLTEYQADPLYLYPYQFEQNKAEYEVRLSSVEINLFKALSVKECQLQSFIGERNSSLGKIHSPSNRLIYEKRLLDALTFCEALKHSENSELLNQLLQAKQKNWPSLVNNYLIEAEPLQSLYVSSQKLLISDSQGLNASLNFLNSLTELINSYPNRASSELEINNFKNSLSGLYNRHFLSRLFYTLEYTGAQLNQVSAMIDYQVNKQACRNEFKPTEIEYLENVFFKYYVALLQPHLAKLDKIQSEIAPKLDKLWRNSQIQQSDFGQRYLTQGNQSVYDHFRLGIEQHTKSWQSLFKQCGLMPK